MTVRAGTSKDYFKRLWGKHGRILLVALLFVFAFFRTAGLQRFLTHAPNTGDAVANVVGAYNLAYHGVISNSENAEENLAPTNYREPLPIFFLAAHIRLHPTLSSGHSVKTINEGKASGALKQHNLFWAFLVLVGVGLTCFTAIRPAAMALPSALIAMHGVQVIFLQSSGIIDMMVTEIQAAALLAWIAFALVRSMRSGRLLCFAASGLLIGFLALTKGIFCYVGPAFIAVLFIIRFIPRNIGSKRRTALCFGVMFLAMNLVVLPWMVRNWLKLGAFEVTQRSGVVMMIRAHMELMSDLEYKGAFWYCAPALLRRGEMDLFKDLHFSMKDLGEGGRLQRLNRSNDSAFAVRDLAAEKAGRPDAALSFYRAGRAERIRLENHYRELGAANPSHLADRDMRREAMRIFMADPWRHLRMSALFLWRGLWCMEAGPLPGWLLFLLNGLSFLALCGMAIGGIFRNHPLSLGLVLLPVGAIALMALTTHFIPRYASMLIPNMLMALVIVTAWGLIWLCRKLRRFF